MGFLDFFRRKAHSNGSTTQTLSQTLCELIRPSIGSPYTDSSSVDKYRSWIYVSSTYNSTNIADGELNLYTNVAPKAVSGKKISKTTLKQIRKYGLKAHSETLEIENHPILDLLHSPNDKDTFYDLIYRTQLFLELTGDAYWLITRDGNGMPIELNVLYSQFVSIEHDSMNRIMSYNYGVAQDGEWQYNFSPEDIIHFKNFDPGDLFYGISPLEACARSYGLIESTTTHEEALNRNLGIPSGVLKYNSQKLRPEDRAIVEAKWNKKFAGVGKSGKVLVTDQDIDYDVVGLTPREMDFLEGRRWSREEIFACYGISPALIITDEVNRSNMITASLNYYHNTLRPRWKLISQTITKKLLNVNGLNGRDVFITIGKEPPADDELIIRKSEVLLSGGAITVNELRNNLGLDALDDAYGDEIASSSSSNAGDLNESSEVAEVSEIELATREDDEN